MKIKNYSFFFFLLILTGIVTFSSCSEDDDDKINIPTTHFTYAGWLYVANGETLKISEFAIDKEKSSEGLHIELVNYYFDGEKISSSTSAPFSLNYPIEGKSIGEHELKVFAKVKGDGYANMEYTVNLTVNVLDEPFALDCNVIYNNANAENGTLKNGENLSGQVELAKSTSFDATITKVEFYWDDKTFGATSIAPFKFDYPIVSEKIGTHQFKIVVYVKSNLGNFTSTIKREIIVEE